MSESLGCRVLGCNALGRPSQGSCFRLDRRRAVGAEFGGSSLRLRGEGAFVVAPSPPTSEGVDMATQTEDQMLSEKIAPVLVARTLGPFDLVVIFVAIVLFINNSAGVQFAG